ncbi:MAG: NusG domain II-containing protein [Ruminococcaceae bacterium]|nr:NusG domain II-containing protein [Oscillospiraceae bacterium]
MKHLRHNLRGKAGDYVIVAVLLLSAGLLFWGFAGREAPRSVEISVDGQEIGRYTLPAQAEYPLADLPYPCTLVIDGYAVALSDTTCPGHDCEHGGAADAGGESIVCLPNRLLIRLTGSGKVDTVVQ